MSLGFGGTGFSGADAAPPPTGDDEQAIIPKAVHSAKSIFQIFFIGANNTFNFSSQEWVLRLGIKLTTLRKVALLYADFHRKKVQLSRWQWHRLKEIPQLFAPCRFIEKRMGAF